MDVNIARTADTLNADNKANCNKAKSVSEKFETLFVLMQKYKRDASNSTNCDTSLLSLFNNSQFIDDIVSFTDFLDAP